MSGDCLLEGVAEPRSHPQIALAELLHHLPAALMAVRRELEPRRSDGRVT